MRALTLGTSTIPSHPVRGAWIEILFISEIAMYCSRSHPVRGAWIEIIADYFDISLDEVAPRQGCVD